MTYEEEKARPEEASRDFLASGALFWAFEGGDLAGVMGLLPETRAATAHRAWIVTVYVRLMCVPPGAERPSRGIFWLR